MLTAALTLALALSAPAERIPTALHTPEGLTAGGYDHFMGQLSPDGKSLTFAGNANSTIEVFVQPLERGAPRVLFDEQADVNQPRISPDGTQLLYISYRQDAGGDACIFDLKTRKRRCLTRPGTAVLHVFWFPDGRSIGALTRPRLDADHQLRRIPTHGRGGIGELLLERNMSAPTVSPDGRWLVYVPLERPDDHTDAARGTLMRAMRGLVLHRLDAAVPPVRFVPPLSGTSSFPAFSPQGSHLYFTQYPNDSNFDGVVDAEDNGVIFRVPFRSLLEQPVGADPVEQLTSGRVDCQYPAPAHDRLLATCVRAGVLQIYALPLDGLVPSTWSTERMEAEIAVSRDPWEELLLLKTMLGNEAAPARRAELLRRIFAHHLAIREYESADDDLDAIGRVLDRPTGLSARRRRVFAEWVALQRERVAHRRAEQRLGHGKLSAEFVDAERERIARIEGIAASDEPSTRRLARLAQGEIALVLGERGTARERFESVDVDAEVEPSVLHAWAGLGEALLRDEPDRTQWLAVHATLANHPALPERERLHRARLYVDLLGRGRAPTEELPFIEDARTRAADGSPLALLLDLEAVLVRLPSIGEATAERELQALWDAAPSFEQHRVLASTTLERAARNEWGHLLQSFGTRWLADVPPDHAERKYAEALYAEVMLERAYVERSHGRVASARDLFRQITRDTDSLEAHVGYIEAALELGDEPDALIRDYRRRFDRADPIEAFAEAYVTARGLDRVRDPTRHAAQVEHARTLLRPVAEALPRSPEVHHLYAYLAHRHFHRTGDKEAAMAAHGRYHLALDLAPNDPRRRASLLSELGLLQAALGNHRIASKHFAQRERLPFVDPHSELAFRLAKARSLFHAGAYAEARAETTVARGLVEREPTLTRFAPLVLDRAALYHYASDDHAGAVALYAALVQATARESLAVRMKARLGLGASALAAGDLELARTTLEQAQALLDAPERFRSRAETHTVASHFERDDYRPLVAGLLAATHRAAGDAKAAIAVLHARRDLHRPRDRRPERDGDQLETARISHQLAELYYRERDLDAARLRIEEGLVAIDGWRSRNDTDIDELTLALVRAAAELHLYGRVPLSEFGFDVEARLRDSYAIITQRPSPRWADERFLFPIYLAMIEATKR